MKTFVLDILLAMSLLCGSCSATGGHSADTDSMVIDGEAVQSSFSADSAYSFVERQVNFGPRVPNTGPHKACGDWLAAKLREYGAEVTLQPMVLTGFDGVKLNAVNILGQYNPDATDRTLLVAHWDTRPWADEDPDPKKHTTPVDGANDGASGVGVLLEISRQLQINPTSNGVDILFVDAEDRGTSGDDESWALGAKYFAENPPIQNYRPSRVILLDMVGGENAKFYREYFSQQNAPQLNEAVWHTAASLGYGDRFVNRYGGAVTDDHLQFQNIGIPAIDIIEYDPQHGFNSRWHTSKDNMEGISKETLKAVGDVVWTVVSD